MNAWLSSEGVVSLTLLLATCVLETIATGLDEVFTMTFSSRAGICFGRSWLSFEYWLRECRVLRLFSFWLVSKFGVSLLSGLYLLGIVALG